MSIDLKETFVVIETSRSSDGSLRELPVGFADSQDVALEMARTALLDLFESGRAGSVNIALLPLLRSS